MRDILKYALHHAARQRDAAGVRRILDYCRADIVNEPCPETELTPLMIACANDDVMVARMLLEKGAKTDIPGFNKRSGGSAESYWPIHVAVESNNLSMVEVILDHGGDIEARTMDGSTPLHIAVESQSEDCVDILLNRGASVKSKYGSARTTALEASYRTGNKKVIDMLYNRCQNCGHTDDTQELLRCSCGRVLYCCEACRIADWDEHEHLCTLVNHHYLRFAEGDRVRCLLPDENDDRVDQFVYGNIVRTWYRQSNFEAGQFAPYQIRLDKGILIYASEDTSEMINLLDEKDLKVLGSFLKFVEVYKKIRLTFRRRSKLEHLCGWRIRSKGDSELSW